MEINGYNMRPIKPKEGQDIGQDIRIVLLVLTLSISLVGLSIILVKAIDPTKTIDPKYSNLILTLLVLIFFVLFSGLYGYSIYQILKNYFEKRGQSKLAKLYFPQFKNLVTRFDFIEDRDDNIQKVIKDLKGQTETDSIMPFAKIDIPETKLIQDRYKFFLYRLSQFNGTKDDLVMLAEEFESIKDMYFKLYVDTPTEQIIRAEEKAEVAKHHKEYYNNARHKYISYMMDYIKFVKEANDAFKSRIFRDYFDRPREL